MPLVKTNPTGPPEPHPVSYGDMVADLESTEAGKRREAARLLAGFPESVRALGGRLLIETDTAVRGSILSSLGRIGGRESVQAVVASLRSEDPGLRNAAIETLQAMGPEVVDEIEALLSDPDSDVRIFAVNVLFSLRHPRVPQLAWNVIKNDPHVNVCAAALDVIAELGSREMLGDLEALVRRFPDEPFLRFAVSAATKQIT